MTCMIAFVVKFGQLCPLLPRYSAPVGVRGRALGSQPTLDPETGAARLPGKGDAGKHRLQEATHANT